MKKEEDQLNGSVKRNWSVNNHTWTGSCRSNIDIILDVGYSVSEHLSQYRTLSCDHTWCELSSSYSKIGAAVPYHLFILIVYFLSIVL